MSTCTADDDIEKCSQVRGFALRLAWVFRSLTAGGFGCPGQGEAKSKAHWQVCVVSDGLELEIDSIRRQMGPIQSLRLAIVDDDEGARSALARLLRCLGHQVQAFESAEAVEAADAARLDVDCLIVDVRLPGPHRP